MKKIVLLCLCISCHGTTLEGGVVFFLLGHSRNSPLCGGWGTVIVMPRVIPLSQSVCCNRLYAMFCIDETESLLAPFILHLLNVPIGHFHHHHNKLTG